MKYITAIALACCSLVFGGNAAIASCSKPVGKFVGSGNGIAYDRTTGNALNVAAFTLSISVASNGAMSMTDVGKDVNGVYSTSYTVAPADHTFSANQCRGTVLLSNGGKYTYTVAAGGTVITFVYTKDDNVLALYNIRLEKV